MNACSHCNARPRLGPFSRLCQPCEDAEFGVEQPRAANAHPEQTAVNLRIADLESEAA